MTKIHRRHFLRGAGTLLALPALESIGFTRFASAASTKPGTPPKRIVFMGMGEPLLNYNNLIQGIEKITSKDGLGLSPKRITVSTSGISKLIINYRLR